MKQDIIDILAKCRKGNRKAQNQLVKRFAPMLMTVCRRYCRDDQMAEDVLQEAWIKIFTNLDKYKPIGPFEGWIRRITINCALQWIDKKYFKKNELKQ